MLCHAALTYNVDRRLQLGHGLKSHKQKEEGDRDEEDILVDDSLLSLDFLFT